MSLSTRRERREQQRRRREHRRPRTSAPGARRRFGRIWIGAGVLVAAVVLVLGAQALGVVRSGPVQSFDLGSSKYGATNEVIGTHEPDESNAHIPAGQKATYQVDPPTSGSHWGAPAAPAPWGIKDTTLPNEVVVHNMEHGGVIVYYKGLTDEETLRLKDLVRTLMQSGFPKMILEPYAPMQDARVALTAWRWQLKLANFDDAQIVRFVRAHYSSPEAPEPAMQ